jgi:hypothetical protein
LFNRKLIPSMETKHVAAVGRQLGDAREAGIIPWSWIVDPTREVELPPTWDNPEAFADYVRSVYGRNKWAAQPRSSQLWSEKSTVAGILQPVINRFEIPFLSVHGWASKTAVRQLAVQSAERPQPIVILYVGDFDPSGMRMSNEDIPGRLRRYRADIRERGAEVRGPMPEIIRVALTQQDLRGLGRSTFPASAKGPTRTGRGDPNYPWFVQQHGQTCAEIDALDPRVLRQRVTGAIMARVEPVAWNRYCEAEQAERESIIGITSTWGALSAVESA